MSNCILYSPELNSCCVYHVEKNVTEFLILWGCVNTSIYMLGNNTTWTLSRWKINSALYDIKFVRCYISYVRSDWLLPGRPPMTPVDRFNERHSIIKGNCLAGKFDMFRLWAALWGVFLWLTYWDRFWRGWLSQHTRARAKQEFKLRGR